jgi:hypothetical protein
MTGFGTDVLALSCILCGAATGGGLTVALLDGHAGHPTGCAVESVSVVPGMVATISDHGHAVVLARPHLALGSGDCQTVVRSVVKVDVDGIRRSVENVRVDVERAREQMEKTRAQVEEAQARLEEKRMKGEEAQAREVQILLQGLDGTQKGGSY